MIVDLILALALTPYTWAVVLSLVCTALIMSN